MVNSILETVQKDIERDIIIDIIHRHYSELSMIKTNHGTLFTDKGYIIKSIETDLRYIIINNIHKESPQGFSYIEFFKDNTINVDLNFDIIINQNSMFITNNYDLSDLVDKDNLDYFSESNVPEISIDYKVNKVVEYLRKNYKPIHSM